MALIRAVFMTFCFKVLISQCNMEPQPKCQVRKFPKGFIFGTATSSYQIEGAWDADGKTENIWDHMTHTRPDLIKDGTAGDIADNSYYLYKRDVEMLRELGVDFYRFSLSWSRILPTSFPDKINEAGVAYYNNLINELLKNNIEPMVTIFHWDLPQRLQELGGWANPNIVDWYADYARTVFTLFGDRVKYWITINEPHAVCHYSYGDTFLAPALGFKGVPEYLCAKNLLVAHATAYHIYDQDFRPKQKGIIFISLSAQWYEPLTESDTEVADEANQFEWKQYSDPIFSKTGDFPPAMKRRIAARSAEQGFFRSRLPEFTQDEIELIRGSSDIFGLNHYFSNYVNRNDSVYGYYESPSFKDDLGVFYTVLPEWNLGESDYMKNVPWGFYKLLTHIRKDYGNPTVFITENGFPTRGGLNDDVRITYYTEYMSAMLDAMEEGADVRAYTAWSLMDNYEWSSGYIEKFGLYEVDYSSPQLTRTPRKSAYFIKEIFRTHKLRRCNNTQIPCHYCKNHATVTYLYSATVKWWPMFCLIVLISQCSTQPRQKCQVRKFPKEFIFGTATSSYQIEGAWKADGKSENIWDRMTHTRPELIRDGSNGDIADNSHNLYKRDVEMLRELGVDFYRFSLSWTRILPTSFPDKINKAGVAYYNNLINELLKYNIQPMVTIYHWDLPQKLQELGGWANPNIVDWYADYARTVFTLFGDRVKYWITINEPHAVCHYSYGDTFLAPALDIKGVPEYLCAKNLLVAHATAYHIYDKEFRSKQQGKIFISFSAQWYEPLTKRDTKAADEANQFEWAQYTHPIYSKTGDFPPAMKRRIAARSAEQGFPRSRLPEFTQDEIEFIRGSSDIFGLNHYFTNYANRNESVYGYYESPSFQDDLAVFYSVLPEWTIGESDYIKFVPWGFYKLLTQIRKDYGNPPIFITENGFATRGGLNDDDRVLYYTEYMSAMLDAMEEGSDVRAYTPWSLMDNYEWSSGYIEKFGLYEVDYSSPQLTRTPRKSAYLMKEIFRTHALRRCNNTQLYGF
ncbi:lactase/phlorizin hydrolase-like [Bicyclus anynana]|uniref:beta-glucosidase n=1 Tax=Bicyclus anynana TaxID=110368 RepID=A0ABM3M7R0_BICAN|nr:lactase/phlorizin hydrolase-like [Bicyclus anynana]